MCSEENKNLDIKIKEAEIERILEEKEKIKAERIIINTPFYKKQQFIQWLIAGIVGGISFIGILRNVIEPIYQRDIIKKEIEIIEHEQKELILKKRNKIILDSIDVATDENEFLLSEIIKQKEKTISIVNEYVSNYINNTKEKGILISTVYFEYNTTVMKEGFVNHLKEVSIFLNNNRNLMVLLDGSSGENITFNDALGLNEERVMVVHNMLLNYGVGVDQIVMTSQGEIGDYRDRIEILNKELEKKVNELNSVVWISLNDSKKK